MSELTGGLNLLYRCECPCELLHANARGICDRAPVVAVWRTSTDLGPVQMAVCGPCADALRARGRNVIG